MAPLRIKKHTATTTSICHMAVIANPDSDQICLRQRKDGTAG
jgi:hypothetical protein